AGTRNNEKKCEVFTNGKQKTAEQSRRESEIPGRRRHQESKENRKKNGRNRKNIIFTSDPSFRSILSGSVHGRLHGSKCIFSGRNGDESGSYRHSESGEVFLLQELEPKSHNRI